MLPGALLSVVCVLILGCNTFVQSASYIEPGLIAWSIKSRGSKVFVRTDSIVAVNSTVTPFLFLCLTETLSQQCLPSAMSTPGCGAVTSSCQCVNWAFSSAYAMPTNQSLASVLDWENWVTPDPQNGACITLFVEPIEDTVLTLNWETLTTNNVVPPSLVAVARRLYKKWDGRHSVSFAEYLANIFAPEVCETNPEPLACSVSVNVELKPTIDAFGPPRSKFKHIRRKYALFNFFVFLIGGVAVFTLAVYHQTTIRKKLKIK